jgi:hypothetical protein
MEKYLPVLLALLMVLSIVSGSHSAKSAQIRVNLVKYEPFPAGAGDYVDVFIKAENLGSSEAINLECELLPEFPFSLDPNEDARKSIGKIPAYDYALIEYMVRVDKNAVDGGNELKIRCSDDGLKDGTSVIHTLRLDVESTNPELVIGLVKSVPEELRAGLEDVKLTLEIQNVGEGDAKLATAELKLPKGFAPSTSYSNVYNLGSIQSDSSKEVVFYMDLSEGLRSGDYPGILTLRYKNDNSNDFLEKTLFFDLRVKPSPSFSVEEIRAGTGTFSDSFTGYIVQGDEVVSPSSITQGGNGELRITLKNGGEEEARSVSVKLFKDSTHPFEFDEIYDFIGNLGPGESSDAVFRFTVDGNAVLKKHLIDVEIRYLEGNDVGTETLTIPFEIAREDSSGMMVYIPIIIVVIVLAGILVWKKRK